MRSALRRPGVWLILAVLAVSAALGVVRARSTRVRVAAVKRGDLEQHVVASGRVWGSAHRRTL
jgi:HlyD family secretion protein